MICGGGNGKETLESYLGLDPHRIEENALALYLDTYTDGPPALLESILMPEAIGGDVSRAAPLDHDPAYINPGLTGAEYPEGVDGAQHSMLFHHSPPSHWTGPGPGSCFDMSSVDLGLTSNDERPSFRSVSDVESPGW